MFDPGIIHLIDGPMNALTLTLDYHRLFGEFKIYFEHTGTQYQYRIDSTERSPFLRDPLFPVTRSLSLSPYHTVDLPSPGFSISTAPLHLLWNLAALANILSGSFVIWRSWMSEKTDRHIWDILQAYDLAGG